MKHPAQAGMCQPQQIPTSGLLLHWVGLQLAWTTRTSLNERRGSPPVPSLRQQAGHTKPSLRKPHSGSRAADPPRQLSLLPGKRVNTVDEVPVDGTQHVAQLLCFLGLTNTSSCVHVSNHFLGATLASLHDGRQELVLLGLISHAEQYKKP